MKQLPFVSSQKEQSAGRLMTAKKRLWNEWCEGGKQKPRLCRNASWIGIKQAWFSLSERSSQSQKEEKRLEIVEGSHTALASNQHFIQANHHHVRSAGASRPCKGGKKAPLNPHWGLSGAAERCISSQVLQTETAKAPNKIHPHSISPLNVAGVSNLICSSVQSWLFMFSSLQHWYPERTLSQGECVCT